MTKITVTFLSILSAVVLGGCNLFQETDTMEIPEMTLNSSAFDDGGRIPDKHAKEGVVGGENVPIPYKWSTASEGTKSFAFTIVDPHEVARDWVHLMVINIPANVTELYTMTTSYDPSGGELINSYGEVGYGGPKPPAGTGDHPYVGTVFALDVENLELDEQLSEAEFLDVINDHVLAKGTYTGFYSQD